MGKPVKKYSLGNIVVTEWHGDYNGQVTKSYSVQKSYKDKDGNWKNVGFFNPSECTVVASIFNYISSLNVKEKSSQQGNQSSEQPPDEMNF